MQRLGKALCSLCGCWWRLILEMLKKHLDVIRSLSRAKKFTIQQYATRRPTANSVTNFSMKISQFLRKENWSPDFCDLKLLDYAIWHIKKKILNKSVKRYEDIEGLSAAISYAWDKLTKKFINNSIEQLRMRLEKVVEGGSHIEHLIWRHWLMIPRTFL